MKILLTSYTHLPDIGGVTSFNVDLCNALTTLGQDVTLATLVAGDDAKSSFAVLRRPSFYRLMRAAHNSDVIIMSNLSLRLGIPVLLSTKPRVLVHHSEAAWSSPNSAVHRIFERILLKSVRHHYATSRFTGKASGLNHTVIYPPFNHRSVTNQPLSYSGRRGVVTFVGRLVKEKGIEYLVKNVDAMLSTLGCDTLNIVGDGDLKGWLLKEIASIDRIKYLGRKQRSEAVCLMNFSDYVIIPSVTNEPFGIVGLEALSSNAVIISSNLGGLPEALGNFAHLYSPDDKASFLQALRTARSERDALISDNQLALSRSRDIDIHLKRFSPDVIAELLLSSLMNNLHIKKSMHYPMYQR